MSDPQPARHIEDLLDGMGAVLGEAREALDDAERLGGLAERIGALNAGPLAALVSERASGTITEADRGALQALAAEIARLETALTPRLGLVAAFSGYLRARTAEA